MKWLQHIQRYDELSYLWLTSTLRRTPKAFLARAVSMSGDGWMYAVVCAVLYMQGHQQAGLLFSTLLVIYAIEVPVYIVLKNTLRRQRPYQRLELRAIIKASDKFSFPSGHTAAAFVFAATCSALIPESGVIVFSWATAVGLSRVALGVHYPTDIVAGALLGGGLAATSIYWLGVI